MAWVIRVRTRGHSEGLLVDGLLAHPEGEDGLIETPRGAIHDTAQEDGTLNYGVLG